MIKKYSHQIKIGSSAQEVLFHILDMNKTIKEVSFWAYSGDFPIQLGEYKEGKIRLTRDEILDRDNYYYLVKNIPSNAELGVFSRVSLVQNKYAHIPLMDFLIPKKFETLKLIIERLKSVSIKDNGWLLDSGVSYHYYGTKLLTDKEWIVFMGKCLLTSVRTETGQYEQISDSRHIGHSLIQGGNVLRITANSGQKPMPYVIDFFSN